MILLYHDNVYSESKTRLTPLSELNGTDLFQVESKSSKDALCHVWLIMGQWTRLLNFVVIEFSQFPYFGFPLKRDVGLLWTNSNPIHPKCFVPFFVEIGRVVLYKTFVNIYIFSISLFVPLRSRAWPLIWTNLNPIHQEC